MSSLLDNISIATPCSAEWDNMSGTDTIRFCGQCSKNVYDISAMSESEAVSFLAGQQMVPCLKFFRRADDTIIFDNCPAGLRRVRSGVKATVKFVSTVLATLMYSVAAFAKDETQPVSHGIRFDWTLSENGHTLPKFVEPPGKESTTGQLAQLGTPSANSIFSIFYKRELPPVYGLPVNDSFGKAIRLSNQGKLTLAEIEFQKALAEADLHSPDPNLTEFIATEYAKLLRKKGDRVGAKKLVARYKVAGTVAVVEVSK